MSSKINDDDNDHVIETDISESSSSKISSDSSSISHDDANVHDDDDDDCFVSSTTSPSYSPFVCDPYESYDWESWTLFLCI